MSEPLHRSILRFFVESMATNSSPDNTSLPIPTSSAHACKTNQSIHPPTTIYYNARKKRKKKETTSVNIKKRNIANRKNKLIMVVC
jgi:hypothetical protein